jgi:uncharacterized FAD-dependent dehydrogenase
LKLELNEAMDYEMEVSNLKKLLMVKYQIKSKDIIFFRLHRKAVDARKKDHVHFVYSIDIETPNEKVLLSKKGSDI